MFQHDDAHVHEASAPWRHDVPTLEWRNSSVPTLNTTERLLDELEYWLDLLSQRRHLGLLPLSVSWMVTSPHCHASKSGGKPSQKSGADFQSDRGLDRESSKSPYRRYGLISTTLWPCSVFCDWGPYSVFTPSSLSERIIRCTTNIHWVWTHILGANP